MRVPMLDLARLHAPLASELEAALARVVTSGRVILGPEVEAFEKDLAAACGVPCAVGCASGSDAVLLALLELGIGPGDQVVCPAYTFFATASAIQRLGATPVFADVDRDSFCTSAETLARAADRCTRLRALLPVDLFGRPADLPASAALARRLGVPLVEDAAQAIGARDETGRPVGARARVATLSFYPTKNLGALGDGGALLCHDEGLAGRLRVLREHGATSPFVHEHPGINSRLDALQAAVLSVKLRHLEAWTRVRAEIARVYDEHFLEAGARRGGAPEPGEALPLRIPVPVPEPGRAVHHQYVLRVPAEDRDPLRGHLAEHGVASAVYYPLGLHQQPCFAHLPDAELALPETEAAARETLALPIHAALDSDQQQAVVDAVLAYFEKPAGGARA